MNSDSDESAEYNGYSPGGAAEKLGMSRPGIMHAIKRGDLDAIRVPVPLHPQGCYWFITPAALERYRKSPRNPGGRPRKNVA